MVVLVVWWLPSFTCLVARNSERLSCSYRFVPCATSLTGISRTCRHVRPASSRKFRNSVAARLDCWIGCSLDSKHGLYVGVPGLFVLGVLDQVCEVLHLHFGMLGRLWHVGDNDVSVVTV